MTLRETALWLGLYIVLSIVPLAAISMNAPPGRGLGVELGVGLGVVAFSVLALQFASTARFRRIAPFFGADAIVLFHRQMGLFAFLLVLAHPFVLFFADPRYLAYLDPRVNAPRAIFLAAALLGLIVLAALPSFRVRLALPYEWWRLTHALAAIGVMIVGLAHSLQVGHYVVSWKQILWVTIAAASLGLVTHTRVVKPWKQRRHPYRVQEVRREHERAWTVVLAPDGHHGMRFVAGQFTWLTLGGSPFALQQHPFSFSSSPREDGRCEVTISPFGDFTATIKDVPPGTVAFLEGPYGSFTLENQPMDGAVFITGGIGITPAVSMLRACRDRHERRPMLLIAANRSMDSIAFKNELEALEGAIDLRVVHVLEHPPEGWTGESGFVTHDVIDRALPRDCRDYHYFVCGPPKMMDLVERGLASHGVPVWNRSVERFSFG